MVRSCFFFFFLTASVSVHYHHVRARHGFWWLRSSGRYKGPCCCCGCSILGLSTWRPSLPSRTSPSVVPSLLRAISGWELQTIFYWLKRDITSNDKKIWKTLRLRNQFDKIKPVFEGLKFRALPHLWCPTSLLFGKGGGAGAPVISPSYRPNYLLMYIRMYYI